MDAFMLLHPKTDAYHIEILSDASSMVNGNFCTASANSSRCLL